MPQFHISMDPTAGPYYITLVLVALITGVISPILVQITRHILAQRKSKSDKKCEVTKNLKNEDQIANKLEKMRTYYGVDRVCLLEFHNGGHTFSGRGFQKFSQTYEAVIPGISLEGPKTQNLPTSLFSRFFKEIVEKQVVVIPDIKDHSSNNAVISSLQNFFEARGIASFVAIGIKNLESELIGLLCLESVKDTVYFTPDQINTLRSDSATIAGYIESMLL